MRQVTTLPLHPGKAPRWLFGRMVKLGRAISLAIIDEYGADELVHRLSDSNWFQALACAIGYDWHSSGTTTVTVAALKEGLNDSGEIYVAGGKGKSGTRTPEEIVTGTDALSIPSMSEKFTESSRLAAKIDASLVYDNIGIYHHSFIFSKNREWAVVQQAMQNRGDMAIRFQWLGSSTDAKDIAVEPHSAIATKMRATTMDLTSRSNEWTHMASVEALEDNAFSRAYPSRHWIDTGVDVSKRGMELIKRAAEQDPKNYRELLLTKGVGRATLRSLAFISSLIYEKDLSFRDPVAYSYNLGGKDGIPFPVPRSTYDSVIKSMEDIVDNTNIPKDEKYKALRRLSASLSSPRRT